MRHTLFKLLALFFIAYSSAQNVNVSGTIQDESGIPIPGVNVLVKNTTKGAVSDFDGNLLSKMLKKVQHLHLVT